MVVSSQLLLAGFLSAFVFFLIVYRKRIKSLYFIILIWFGSLLLVGSVDFVFNEILEPHQKSRINVVLGLESDPLGRGYNVNQSKIAIGSGGLFGKGFTAI